MELLNWLRERLVGGGLDHPDVLLLLEAGRYVSGEGSLLLEGQVLGFVSVAE